VQSIRWPIALIALLLAAPTDGTCAQQEAVTGARPEVALTFDDLPAHGDLPPGLGRAGIARKVVAALRAAHAPAVYGFVNAKELDEDPHGRVLKIWRAAGFPLGNHTYSHLDLNANSAEAFEQDILLNEPTLRKYMKDHDWHWLRYPYLRAGDTLEKHHAVAAFLKAHGYRVAEVTLDFDDYAYNDPYARCLARHNQAAIDWLKESYLSRAAESLELGQKMSDLVYGREIKHVMLLHIGGFETVMLPQLLDLLAQRGFKLITLEEAESDPAYAAGPDLPSLRGETLLQQMMTVRHIAPLPHSEIPFDTLGTLCR
jgi:peptidoglycan/xylan/chitin deacetylase (PgdA/CDA1 family)